MWLLQIMLLVAFWVTNAAASTATRQRAQDGNLSLLVAVPLTRDNQTVVDPGFFHLAAAQLAVEHFNARNASVVQELASNNSVWQDCNIQFGKVVAVDTRTHSHNAMEELIEKLQEKDGILIDAIAGPYNEIPMLELSVMATGMQAPMVSQRVFDTNLLIPSRHPYFSQVGADFYSEMTFVATYLQHLQRDNYVAIVYSTSASVMQKVDILRVVLEKKGFDQVQTFSYNNHGDLRNTLGGDHTSMGIADALDITSVLHKVEATGYRTILWMPAHMDDDETTQLGKAATDLGLDEGEHLWIVSGGMESMSAADIIDFAHRATAKLEANFLRGACHIAPYDGYELNHQLDFRTYLRNHDLEFFTRVQNLNPIPNYFRKEIRKQFINQDDRSAPFWSLANTQYQSYASGSSFMYDAVMSIGLGACLAASNNNNHHKNGTTTTMTGKHHLKGIQSLDFIGASGRIVFGNVVGHPGSRVGNTVPYTVANFVPGNESDGLVIRQAESLDPVSGEWIQFNPYVFGDGSDRPPQLLRSQPEQNYITMPVRAAGMALFGISLGVVIASFVWIIAHRGHTVVVAAQPIFLYTLCLASLLMCFSILFGAFDESWGFTQKTLDKACLAWTWIDSLGSMFSYSAIFTKLWRADRCLRFNTSQIETWRALYPCALLIVTVVSILTTWTLRSNYGWVREVIDPVTGESVGFCAGDHTTAYLTAIYTLHLIPIAWAGIMAWKTLGLDDLYSESKWVLALILVQIQVLLVTVPVVTMLDNLDPSARYMGLALMTFTFPMSTMGLIILPKVVLVHQMKKKAAIVPPTNGSSSPAAASASASASRTSDGEQPGSTNTISSNDGTGTGNLQQQQQQQRSSNGRGPRIQIVTFD